MIQIHFYFSVLKRRMHNFFGSVLDSQNKTKKYFQVDIQRTGIDHNK